jgi:hypothetical protein
MKSTWCLIWILIALVASAAVDRVPDPPSAKPDGVQLSVSSPSELPPAFGATSRLLILAFWQSEQSAAFVPSEPVPPTDRIEPLERAADPSPPTLHS